MASLKLIALGCCLLATCQASAPVTNTHFASVIPGEYLVELKPGRVGLSSAANIGITILDSFHIGDYRALHVKVDDSQLAALTEDANVKVIEANAREFHATCTPQQSGSRLYGLSRLSTRSYEGSWDGVTYDYEDTDGAGVKAYIIDTGIYIENVDFEGRAQYGFVAPGHTSEGDDDLNGHGTHCAGTVGGSQYGVAKGVTLVGVKVLGRFGSGATSDVVAGINYVANNQTSGQRSVMNLSLGMTGESTNVNNALREAIAAGISAAVAAGNSNADACNYSPAMVREALTVVASDINNGLPTFTNYGPCTDVIAPGNNILSTYIGGPTATATLSGTSMAAPHVCGWVARHIGAQATNPTPAQIATYLEDNGTENEINLGSKSAPNLVPFTEC